MASATEPRPSLNKTALAVAWLTLAAAIAGAGGYLVVARQSPPQFALHVALPEASEVEPAPPSQLEAAAEQSADPAADQPEVSAPVADTPPRSDGDPPLDEPEGDVEEARAEPPGEEPRQDQDAESASEEPPGQSAEVERPPDDAPPEAPESAAIPEDQAAAPAPPAPEAADQPAEAPTVASDGASSKPLWRQFATAVDVDRSRPRIAVVVSGLGLSTAATEAAIDHLPAYVTLSFSPYARRLNQWIALARVKGHEVMLDLPMEPVGYPNLDPGPHALLTTLNAEQNLERLGWILKRGTSFVGVAAMMGSRFTGSEDHLYPVMKELQERGLLFLDNRAISSTATRAVSQQLGMPLLINDRAIDEAQASRVAIDSRLAQIERLALTNGAAVAMGQPYPVTIERLRNWTALLSARGFALVPITALVPEPQSG